MNFSNKTFEFYLIIDSGFKPFLKSFKLISIETWHKFNLKNFDTIKNFIKSIYQVIDQFYTYITTKHLLDFYFLDIY